MTIRDNTDYIRVLLYSYYITITGWGVLLRDSKDTVQESRGQGPRGFRTGSRTLEQEGAWRAHISSSLKNDMVWKAFCWGNSEN